MTWVIGAAGYVARGVLLSDVRVTLHYPNGGTREIDCLQKVYPLNANIAAGFSGNVDAGLRLLTSCAGTLRSRSSGAPIPEPSRAIFKWLRQARFLWQTRFPDELRTQGCTLMFVAALPPSTHDWPPMFIERAGALQPTVGYVACAPHFTPIPMPRLRAVSIGSGADLSQFEHMLNQNIGQLTNDLDDDPNAPMKLLRVFFNTWVLGDAIARDPQPGISEHFHFTSVRWNEIIIGMNGRNPPPIVSGLDEWHRWSKRHGLPKRTLAVG